MIPCLRRGARGGFSLVGSSVFALLVASFGLTSSSFAHIIRGQPWVVTKGHMLLVWLTLEDLSRYLKKPASTLYKLVVRGEVPGHKLGRNWRFDRDEVDAWIKGRGVRVARRRMRG